MLGTSMGGFVAQLVAIHHPGRVRSPISASSTPDPRLGGIRLPVIRQVSRISKTAETSQEQAGDLAVRLSRLGIPVLVLRGDRCWTDPAAR